MTITFTASVGSSRKRKATLTPSSHPKGGEAWAVQIDGTEAGTLRRWERDETSMTITPTSGSFRKVRKTYWTVYPLGRVDGGRVYPSRTAALRSMVTQ